MSILTITFRRLCAFLSTYLEISSNILKELGKLYEYMNQYKKLSLF